MVVTSQHYIQHDLIETCNSPLYSTKEPLYRICLLHHCLGLAATKHFRFASLLVRIERRQSIPSSSILGAVVAVDGRHHARWQLPSTVVLQQRVVTGTVLFGVGQRHLKNCGGAQWLFVPDGVAQFADGGRTGEGALLVAGSRMVASVGRVRCVARRRVVQMRMVKVRLLWMVVVGWWIDVAAKMMWGLPAAETNCIAGRWLAGGVAAARTFRAAGEVVIQFVFVGQWDLVAVAYYADGLLVVVVE